MDACLLSSTPTTTTTTTSVLPPTTQLLPTTTTTFVVPTTTQRNPTTTQTTTKPLTTTSTTAPFHYGGDWTFFGELVAETVDCVANDPYFDRDVVVSHSPGAADIAAGIEFLPALYGTADKNGFEVGTQIDLNECTQTVYFTAERTPRADRMNAELIIDTICPEEACTAWYFGDLEQ
jgi:hypothetical protein